MSRSGEYVELTVDNLHDGDFRTEFDKALREVAEGLHRFEVAQHAKGGKAKLSVEIEIVRGKHDEFLDVLYVFKKKLPTAKFATMERFGGGKLLRENVPAGHNSLNGQDQLPLFHRDGSPGGHLDPKTGELVDGDDEQPAGRIGAAAG